MSKRWREVKHKKVVQEQKQTILSPTKYLNRIKAFIVDMFMIYTPILYIITYLFMNGKDDFQSSNIAPMVATMLYGLIYAIFVSKKGQTPGKKAYNIKIVDKNSLQNITFFKAFFRFFMFLVSATTLFGVIMPLIKKGSNTLHDYVCNTVVIDENKTI